MDDWKDKVANGTAVETWKYRIEVGINELVNALMTDRRYHDLFADVKICDGELKSLRASLASSTSELQQKIDEFTKLWAKIVDALPFIQPTPQK